MHKYSLFLNIWFGHRLCSLATKRITRIKFSSYNLVHSVGNSMAGVELDGGEDGLTGWGSSISSWGDSGNSWGGSIGSWGNSSNSRGSSISGSGNSWGSSIDSWGISRSSWGNSGNRWGNSSSISSWDNSLGSSNNWGSSITYRCNSSHSRSNRQIVANNTESEVISNVVDSVDSSLISIGVGSSNSTKSIATLLLGTVDVLVPIGNISKLILSLKLRGNRSRDGSSSGNSSQGSSSNRWGRSISSWGSSKGSSSNSWGSSISSWSSINSDGSRGSSVSSSIGGWGSSVSSSIGGWGSSNNIVNISHGSIGNSRGIRIDRASSEGSSIEGCDGSPIGKLSINIGGIRGRICSCCQDSIVETSRAEVGGSDREAILSGTRGQQGGNNC